MRLSRAVICLLVGFFVAQTAFYYPNLPAQMAVHFNAAGQPDNWTSRENFFIFEIILLLAILAEFSLLPFLLEKSPESLINLPHREYWLMPERRSETFEIMRKYFEWLAVGLLALFIAINQLTFEANITQTNLPPLTMWTIIGAFIIYTIGWMIKFVRQFKINKL